MNSFLCTVVSTSVTQLPAFWVFIFLICAVVISFGYIYTKQYLYRKKCITTQNNLKVGDKIKTFSGILGEVVKISETESGRVVTIKNLEKEFSGYLTIDVLAVCALIDEENN